MSDKEFISRLKEHQGIIYKLVHLYADNEEDKKDLYQEILFQAWKSYPGFRGESKFSTWLYRLCLNTIFTLQKRINRVEYTDTRQFEETYAEEPNINETERLYMALRSLAETDRAVVSLHLDGYSNPEIGTILGITPNLVGVKFHRAKQQLASLLKNI